MKIEQRQWRDGKWTYCIGEPLGLHADLVLAFGAKEVLAREQTFIDMKRFYPNARIASCSTAGEIFSNIISDGTISLTAIQFASTRIEAAEVQLRDETDSYDAGVRLIQTLQAPDLVYVLVLSDGQIVNGSELVRAFGSQTAANVITTGGLAGDGTSFQTTLVGLDKPATKGNVIAIGFYGEKLLVGHASQGGWDPFGPERIITKSKNNVLFELDDQSALELYKKYLGDLANELPGSALLFPLSIRIPNSTSPLVRTVLSIDEKAKSMTFAGDMPQGSVARLMKSNFERLIDSASVAADSSVSEFGSFVPELAILISCVGRKIVLKERVEEELERVREVLGPATSMCGFYSYGEISPVVKSTSCQLHNQTMTITTIKEID